MSDLADPAEKSPQNKITLRIHILTERRSLSASTRATAADQTLSHVRAIAAPTVAAYAPLGSEPGGAELPDRLAALGARVLLPILLPENDLDWGVYTGELTVGARGLREPTGPRLGVDGLREAGLILVPALAVDRAGIRLGRGGGSYDRALARVPVPPGPTPHHPLVVALLHDGEAVETVPAEPHDRPVGGVITPTGGFSPRPLGGAARSLRPGPEWTN
ncbi:5-formyltetrahydrofolate cyclo-ligase [Actinoplanes sp. NPDC051851]|uniref:5-formyltetrahydrofolate cyclo-ligase n=1 Tax=Actinoplanes sp. NPDC051851 TaxID=3154753 RepID=UPI003426ED68